MDLTNHNYLVYYTTQLKTYFPNTTLTKYRDVSGEHQKLDDVSGVLVYKLCNAGEDDHNTQELKEEVEQE